jgi:hypothetical protein
VANQCTRSFKLPRLKPLCRNKTTQIGLGLACTVTILTAIVVVLLKSGWSSSAPANKVSDPSVVIGTFTTLYGLFIAAFGVLVGFLAKKGRHTGCREVLRVAAIALLAGATILDLFRVVDATNDLLTAATSGMSYRDLAGTVFSFKIYFSVNMLVVAFSIAVACLLPGPPEVSRGSQAGKDT